MWKFFWMGSRLGLRKNCRRMEIWRLWRRRKGLILSQLNCRLILCLKMKIFWLWIRSRFYWHIRHRKRLILLWQMGLWIIFWKNMAKWECHDFTTGLIWIHLVWLLLRKTVLHRHFCKIFRFLRKNIWQLWMELLMMKKFLELKMNWQKMGKIIKFRILRKKIWKLKLKKLILEKWKSMMKLRKLKIKIIKLEKIII